MSENNDGENYTVKRMIRGNAEVQTREKSDGGGNKQEKSDVGRKQNREKNAIRPEKKDVKNSTGAKTREK